jgi:hypothetical protein
MIVQVKRFPDYYIDDETSEIWSFLKPTHNAKQKRWKKLKQRVVNGYLTVSVYIDKVGYCVLVHRLLMESLRPDEWNPELQVDHIDGNRMNNSIDNLRMVTLNENIFNNLHFVKGYFYNKATGKYHSEINAYGKKYVLGSFNTKEEAREAYLKAKKKYHKIGD